LEPGVRLETRAAVVDNMVTYEIYPVNLSRQRIWDFWVHAPLPAGATFLSAEAPGIFTYGFNGQEVTFFTLELPADTDVGPLRIKVSVPQVAPGQLTPAAVQGQPAFQPAPAEPIISLLTAQVWANWRNAGRDVGRRVEAEAKSSSGDMIINPEAGEHVVFDQTGDVPFASYDLTALGLQKIGPTLELIFHTAAPLGPVGEPLEYTFYIDHDCLAGTGTLKEGFGMDHRIRYRHNRGRITVESWLPDTPGPEAGQTTVEPGQAEAALVEPPPASWHDIEGIDISPIIVDNKLILQLPYDLVDDDGQFCWLAKAANRTQAFASRPPDDELPNEDALMLAHIQLLLPPAEPAPVQ